MDKGIDITVSEKTTLLGEIMQSERSTRITIDEKGLYHVKMLDINQIIALAQGKTSLSIDASGSTEEPREITGEELLALTKAAGGTVVVVRDASGVIESIEASGVRPQQLSFEDLAEFVGVDPHELEPAELIEGLIKSIEAAGAKKITGDLAQTSVSTAVTFTATLTSSATTVGSPSSLSGIPTGVAVPVSGTGIPNGTTITVTSGVATLSQAATASGASVSITASVEAQVIGLAEWTLSWKRNTAMATTTDDSAYESSLGSSASWSVKSKYMFLVGETSQANAIIAAITSPQAPQQWNFFPDITLGHPAYSGLAYIDGIDIAAGVGKIVGLDVSLKGTGPLTVGTQLAPVTNTNTITGQQAEI